MAVNKEKREKYLIIPSIAVFVFCVLFFNVASLAIFTSMAFFGILVILEALFYKKIPKEKIKIFRKWILTSFIILFILDIILTFLGTQYFKVGRETNYFLNFLWGIFGYWIGELIDIILTVVIINLLAIYSNHKNYYVSAFITILIFFLAIGFFLAVFNNILILFNFGI